jgi:hypothetical protein
MSSEASHCAPDACSASSATSGAQTSSRQCRRYRSPIVERAAYVRVDDETLRGQLEETLIKFLKSNAVINQNFVER